MRSPPPPSSLLAALDLVIAERRKKRPSEKLTTGLLFLVGAALDSLRMAAEGRRETVAGALQQLRTRLLEAARAGELDPGLLLLIGRQFASAKLDLGDELREMMVALAGEHAQAEPQASPQQLEEHYAAMAAALGHDPFAIHAELADSAASFPVEPRLALIATAVYAKESALREASLGWLLDRSAEIGKETGVLIANAARQSLVSPRSCNRMVLLRNWVAETCREPIDDAIRACRKREVPAVSERAPEVREVLLSGTDGAGAQSAFVVLKEGRSFVLASLLLKHGHGVKDAWVRREIRRAEADEMLTGVNEEVEHFAGSIAAIETCLANALAINLVSRTPPPFGLVDFVETVGLQAVRPVRLTGDELINRFLAEIPAGRKKEAQVAGALAASARWPLIYTGMQSWFEEGEPVDRVLSAVKTRKKRLESVLNQILPVRRSRWAELLAWTALALRAAENSAWTELALVAHELRGERPLKDIPLAGFIARNTVEAYAG